MEIEEPSPMEIEEPSPMEVSSIFMEEVF